MAISKTKDVSTLENCWNDSSSCSTKILNRQNSIKTRTSVKMLKQYIMHIYRDTFNIWCLKHMQGHSLKDGQNNKANQQRRVNIQTYGIQYCSQTMKQWKLHNSLSVHLIPKDNTNSHKITFEFPINICTIYRNWPSSSEKWMTTMMHHECGIPVYIKYSAQLWNKGMVENVKHLLKAIWLLLSEITIQTLYTLVTVLHYTACNIRVFDWNLFKRPKNNHDNY